MKTHQLHIPRKIQTPVAQPTYNTDMLAIEQVVNNLPTSTASTAIKIAGYRYIATIAGTGSTIYDYAWPSVPTHYVKYFGSATFTPISLTRHTTGSYLSIHNKTGKIVSGYGMATYNFTTASTITTETFIFQMWVTIPTVFTNSTGIFLGQQSSSTSVKTPTFSQSITFGGSGLTLFHLMQPSVTRKTGTIGHYPNCKVQLDIIAMSGFAA